MVTLETTKKVAVNLFPFWDSLTQSELLIQQLLYTGSTVLRRAPFLVHSCQWSTICCLRSRSACTFWRPWSVYNGGFTCVLILPSESSCAARVSREFFLWLKKHSHRNVSPSSMYVVLPQKCKVPPQLTGKEDPQILNSIVLTWCHYLYFI